MSTPRALRQPLALRLSSAGFLALWCLIAAFPLFWILVMSFKIPVDSFAANPLSVVFGPATRAAGKGPIDRRHRGRNVFVRTGRNDRGSPRAGCQRSVEDPLAEAA